MANADVSSLGSFPKMWPTSLEPTGPCIGIVSGNGNVATRAIPSLVNRHQQLILPHSTKIQPIQPWRTAENAMAGVAYLPGLKKNEKYDLFCCSWLPCAIISLFPRHVPSIPIWCRWCFNIPSVVGKLCMSFQRGRGSLKDFAWNRTVEVWKLFLVDVVWSTGTAQEWNPNPNINTSTNQHLRGMSHRLYTKRSGCTVQYHIIASIYITWFWRQVYVARPPTTMQYTYMCVCACSAQCCIHCMHVSEKKCMQMPHACLAKRTWQSSRLW